jgi:hypothetical protein
MRASPETDDFNGTWRTQCPTDAASTRHLAVIVAILLASCVALEGDEEPEPDARLAAALALRAGPDHVDAMVSAFDGAGGNIVRRSL